MDNEVNVDRVGDALNDFWSEVVSWIPEFIGAVLIIGVGYLVAVVVARLLRRGLKNFSLNSRIRKVHGGALLKRAIPDAELLVATVTKWLIMFGAVSLAATVVGVPGFSNLVNSIYGYIPNVVVSIVIFLVASAIASAAVTLVNNTMGNTPTGRLAATAAPIVVMSIAVFMILDQLEIATQIVTITYAALIGGASLGLALAFGLGGRDVAGKVVANAYESGKRNISQTKRGQRK